MTTCLYARVSRDDLHCENQTQVLTDWATRNGITDYKIYTEELSTRKTRPIKDKILLDFRNGKYDTIAVVKLDRWARSLQELVMDVRGVVDSGGRFVCISNGLDFKKDTYNATANLTLQILGAFAEFEREMIRERTMEGLARAKAAGRVGGRPRKHLKRPGTKPNLLSKAGEVLHTLSQNLEKSPVFQDPRDHAYQGNPPGLP